MTGEKSSDFPLAEKNTWPGTLDNGYHNDLSDVRT